MKLNFLLLTLSVSQSVSVSLTLIRYQDFCRAHFNDLLLVVLWPRPCARIALISMDNKLFVIFRNLLFHILEFLNLNRSSENGRAIILASSFVYVCAADAPAIIIIISGVQYCQQAAHHM